MQLGHTVVTRWQLGMMQAEDAEHLLHAAQSGRVLVTRDKDFSGLHVAWQLWVGVWQVQPQPEHGGILLVPSHWSVTHTAREVDAFVQGGPRLTNVMYEHDGARWRQR